jgi:lactoylglutathione lyase
MSVPSPIAPGHAGLSVTDLDRSVAFYREVLALEVVHQSSETDRRYAFLGVGGRAFLTLWQQSHQPHQPDAAGLHHLAFELPTLDAVRAVEARLRVRGITPRHDGMVPHSEGAESAALFFTDPDGIRLELYSPTGAAALTGAATDGPACGFF